MLGGVVGGSIGGGLLEDHCLVQPVNGADLLAGLDAGKQPQRPGAVSAGADAEPVEQPLRELGVRARDEHRRPAGRQGPLIELGRGERFELAQVKAPVESRHLHRDVLERDSAARHMVGAQHCEPAAGAIGEGHRDRAPGGAVDAPQHLVGEGAGAGFAAIVNLAAQVREQVALFGVPGAPGGGVIRGAVERGIGRHHQREIRVEDGRFPGAGRTRQQRRFRVEVNDGVAVEPAPVHQLHRLADPLGLAGPGRVGQQRRLAHARSPVVPVSSAAASSQPRSSPGPAPGAGAPVRSRSSSAARPRPPVSSAGGSPLRAQKRCRAVPAGAAAAGGHR